MKKEQVENIKDAALAAQSGQQDVERRERSTIQFPYNDLDDAVTIAKAVHENAGLSCTADQLAAYLSTSLTSGAFRVRMANASTFGLTENQRGEVHLTPLGRRIADRTLEAVARVEAFLAVQLYDRIHENYKGFTLPGAAALEKFMSEVGVSPKQTGKARQAFMRSARQAGFFAHGEDRLVRPTSPGTKPIEEPKQEPKKSINAKKSGDDGEPPDLHPFIQGLLKELPRAGEMWPEVKRKLWLDTAASIFKMIYKDELRQGAESNIGTLPKWQSGSEPIEP